MNPTSPPLLHEKRFCLSLFFSQVIVVLVVALFLYFTLIVPTRDVSTVSQAENSSESTDTEPESSSPVKSTDDFASPVSEVGEGDESETPESECLFIPSNKLPYCANDSRSWNYEHEPCSLLITLSCNGNDYHLEKDEDATATISCPTSEYSHSELILHLERWSEIFMCSVAEENGHGSQCRNIATDSNFCPGLLLSCICANSSGTTATLRESEASESATKGGTSWSNSSSNVMRLSFVPVANESGLNTSFNTQGSQGGQLMSEELDAQDPDSGESESIDVSE